MKENFYKNILYNSPFGYAFHEIILDENGVPCNYKFIEVNPAFEMFTGLKAKDIIDHTVLEVIPSIINDEFNWIKFYGDIALNNHRETFEGFSSVLNSWYKVEAFSPEKNFFVTIFRDITKAKMQNAKYLELESVFSSLVKHAPVPIMIHSNDGQVLNISDAWTEITGYSKEEIPTMKEWSKAAYGLKQDDVIEVVNKLYDLNQRQHDGEFLIHTKDNREVLWDFYSTYIGNTPDDRRMAMSVAIDVTEDRKNKADLVKERLLFETTLLSVGDGVICTNQLGEVTLINKIAEELTGWGKKDAIGKKIENVFSIYSEDTGIKSENIVETVVKTGIIHELANHTILVSKDGTERQIADSAAPIILNDGNIIGAVLVFRDYSDKYKSQKEIEGLVKELQRTQTLLKASLNSPQDILILSLDTEYNYLFFNETHQKAMKYAYNTEAEIGKNLFDCITVEEDIHKSKINYGKALSGITHITLEQYGEVNITSYETIYSPIKDTDNQIIGVTAFARDVSERERSAKALRDEKEKALEYLNIAAVMIIVLDANGNVTLINRAGCEILGYEEKDILGKNWFDHFLPKNLIKPVKEVFNDVFNKRTLLNKQYENAIVNAKGEERQISWYNSVLYDSDANIVGVLSSGEDITESKIMTEKLKDSELRYRELINNLDAGIVIHASDTSIISFNKRAEEILGLSYDELHGVTAASSKFQFVNSTGDVLKYEDYPVNVLIRNKRPIKDYLVGVKHIHDEGVVWAYVNGISLFDTDGNIKEIVISFVDITEEKMKQDQILHLSNHDYLTNLYNRRYFVDTYKVLDNEAYYPLGVMMIDVNGLKIINDAFGHDAGDVALKKVSDILQKSCRGQDVVCRIGGDEFAVILPNITKTDLETINKSIHAEAMNNDVENVSLSLATGYEIKTKAQKGDLDEILKTAENQMYRHKLAEGISIRNNAIKAILKTLTNKYKYERIHSERVSDLCKQMGEALNLNAEDIKELEMAGMYHDIGKISIPDAILNKPERLSEDEFEIIKTHPEISYQILRAADEYSDLAIHALYHHERWDGKGYPTGKRGTEIPLFSRIICIIDAYEAMTADRVYKEKLSEDEAVTEIIRCSGSQFDERIAKIFVQKILHKEWN